ncbi:CBS domain-containing protein [Allosalinactinospora lopnorensis]|uniref:CBS domain-containing protein n=1 Tax=Allosalinactinospora lopnorensis TaxID=1352348 RepID=UPI000623EC92|nr:CBS domain-containing protein [Allosalinactinospora lopnorensis]
MNRYVGDLMTTSVVTVAEGAKFHEIAALMREYGVSSVPVTDTSGHVVGVISNSDLLLKLGAPTGANGTRPDGVQRARNDRRKATAITAAGLMTSPATTIGPQATAPEAAQVMRRHQIKRLPVVDEGGKLLGLVSRGDLLRVDSRTDTEIFTETKRGLTTEFRSAPVEASVSDGIVVLTGRVRRRSTIFDILRSIRHIEGVVRVENRLDYEVDNLSSLSRPAWSADHSLV